MKYYNNLSKIEKEFKNTAVISYPFHFGGQLADRMMWMMTINGEVEDYHIKKELIEQAKNKNLNWIIIKYHRKLNKLSIVKKSKETHN